MCKPFDVFQPQVAKALHPFLQHHETLSVLIVPLACRDDNKQHATPGLAIVAAVDAAAHRGGAAWNSVKSLLPQVHIALSSVAACA